MGHHLLLAYLKSLQAVMHVQFTKKGLRGGKSGVVQLAEESKIVQVHSRPQLLWGSQACAWVDFHGDPSSELDCLRTSPWTLLKAGHCLACQMPSLCTASARPAHWSLCHAWLWLLFPAIAHPGAAGQILIWQCEIQ